MRVILCGLMLIGGPLYLADQASAGTLSPVTVLVIAAAMGAAAMGLWTQYQRTFRH